MDAVVVPALDLGIPAALATGAAALAAAQAGVAAVQAATPRSTVQQLQDSGIIGQRVRRLSNTARRASMSVISVQQQWLISNLEVMLSPRSSFVDGLDAAPTAAAPMLTTAKTLAGVPQALMEGRVLFSAKLSALMAATSGVLAWYGASATTPEQAADDSTGGGAANYYMLGAAVGALLLGTAGFLAGRKSAPAQDVRWQREENSDGQPDGSKKKRARLQRVPSQTL